MYILVVVSFISIYLGKNTNTQLQWHPLSSFALVRVHIQNSSGQAQVDMGTNLGEEGEGGGSLECPHVVAVFFFFSLFKLLYFLYLSLFSFKISIYHLSSSWSMICAVLCYIIWT